MIEKDYFGDIIMCGMAIYPYQIAFGFSLRFWAEKEYYFPSLRIHIICFKFYIGIKIKKSVLKSIWKLK